MSGPTRARDRRGHNFYEMVAGHALPQAADDAFDSWLADRSLTRDELDAQEW
jgi:hypothetical protein